MTTIPCLGMGAALLVRSKMVCSNTNNVHSQDGYALDFQAFADAVVMEKLNQEKNAMTPTLTLTMDAIRIVK